MARVLTAQGRADAFRPLAADPAAGYDVEDEIDLAALAPRTLGLRFVLARGFARIHWQNLLSYGVLPLEFVDGDDHARIEPGDALALDWGEQPPAASETFCVKDVTRGLEIAVRLRLSPRQQRIVAAGGLSNLGRRGEPA